MFKIRFAIRYIYKFLYFSRIFPCKCKRVFVCIYRYLYACYQEKNEQQFFYVYMSMYIMRVTKPLLSLPFSKLCRLINIRYRHHDRSDITSDDY